jgi:hypothetical protein
MNPKQSEPEETETELLAELTLPGAVSEAGFI